MPKRIRWRDFNRGLWVAGGRDDCPPDALRRATGISQLKENAIRSARGALRVNQSAANQYVRFDDALFQGRGADVLRDDVAINAAFPQSPGDFGRLGFLRMPPQADLVDWLFVGGGGNPFKVKADGTDASKWGIDAPPDGFTAGSDKPYGDTKPISTMDDATDWVRVESAGANPTDETTITVSTASVKWAFTQAGTNRYVDTADFAITANLKHFGTGASGHPSADQDYIDFWIRLSNGTDDDTTVDAFAWMEIAFSIGDDDFTNNAFTRKIEGVDTTLSQAGLETQQPGVGTYALDNNTSDTDVVGESGIFNAGADQRPLFNAIAQTTIMRQNDVWQRIRVPKSTFDRVGSDSSLGWGDVMAARLTFCRTGKITIYVDQLSLTGGYGLIGKYQYLVTYKNSETGSRSNPNPTPVVATPVNRGRLIVGNLPISTDPQVDVKEIWRTVGNGALFFLDAEIPNTDTFYVDETVDFPGMFTASYLTDADLPPALQPIEVQLDNAPPETTVSYVLGAPHVGRGWYLDSASANRGNAYYTAIGRPESAVGFASVTTQSDNTTQALVVWNDVLYCVTSQGFYRIIGDDEPFTVQEVFGVPGTLQPDTVRATPFGIIWQAVDGVRIFDGSQSTMLGLDALGPIFRGYTAEGLVPFVGITACYYQDDFFVSDSAAYTLVCNLRTQTWRVLDLVCKTLYASPSDALVYASIGPSLALGETDLLERDDAEIAIPYQVQTPSFQTAVDTLGIVQRVFVDIDPGGYDITPTLVYDDSEVVLALIAGSGRQTVEYARLDLSRLVALRLDAQVLADPIVLYGVEFDVTVPAGSGSEDVG